MRGTAVHFIGFLVILVALARAQAPPAAPLTLVSPEGRRSVATTIINGQEMISLDEVAALFPVAVKEDTVAGGVTVSYRGRTIVISANQATASVDGRVVALPFPVQRNGRRWLVPVEFLQIALAPIYNERIQVRRGSRLVLVGNVQVPRVTARITPGAPTRLTADITPAADISTSQDGSRVLVRVDAHALDLSLPAEGAGLIEQVRLGEQPNTLVVSLSPDAGPASAVITTAATGSRLILEVPPAASAGTPAIPPELAPIDRDPLVPPRPVLETIVLDPGHGGDDEGVRGRSGTLEKTVALEVARRLGSLLEMRLGTRVLLTRTDDVDVGLDRRAAVANNAEADLFLSLHANSAPAPAVAGAEVYYLQLDREGEQARQEAAAAAVALPVVGGGTRTLEILRWDLAQARHVEESAMLAATMASTLSAQVAMGPSPVRRAPLRVLEGVNMPAVLVELAYLSSPTQEELAASDEYADRVAQALFEGVVRFRRYLEEQGPR